MMNRKHTTIKTHKRQTGLTLLELTVVLLVLIGLSGLVLPYAQGYLQRTHDSTGNDALWSLNNAIHLFATKYFEQPEGYHTLIETGGTNVYGALMNPNLVAATTYTEDGAATMSASEIPLQSLIMGGINNLWDMKDDATNGSKTFDAANAQVPVPMPNSGSGASINVALLQATKDFDGDGTPTVEEHLAKAFYNNVDTNIQAKFDTTCYDYVVFGIGSESEMVGKVMAEAPLHFASTGGMGPDKKYNRFVAVYQVDKNNTAPCSENTEPAKLVGTAMLMMQPHLWGQAYTQAHTWENIANKNN